MINLNLILSISLIMLSFLVILSSAQTTDDQQLSTTVLPHQNKTTNTTKPRPSKTFTRLHGCSMTIGWLGVTPIAILISRHFRQDPNYPTLANIWFRLHSVL